MLSPAFSQQHMETSLGKCHLQASIFSSVKWDPPSGVCACLTVRIQEGKLQSLQLSRLWRGRGKPGTQECLGRAGAGSGTCALSLGEAAGDDLPDAGRQAGGPRVLGRAPPVQARL